MNFCCIIIKIIKIILMMVFLQFDFSLPWTLSARELCPVSLTSSTGARCGFSPSTLSSFEFQYMVAIVARHLSFKSPFLKCLCSTWNSNPNIALSRPSSSDATLYGPRKNELFTYKKKNHEFYLKTYIN